jgi:hypothetical protein
LEFTTSEPIITERCANPEKIEKLSCGYVKETIDSIDRCIQLEFYRTKNMYFEAVDLPSMVKFVWTDSSLIEILQGADGLLFSTEQMIRPNMIEYILSDSLILKKKEFFNGNLTSSKEYADRTINDIYFLMYSGCKIKYSKKYRMKF